MKNSTILSIIASFLMLACTSNLYSRPPTPQPIPVITDTEMCDAAEANLIKLGCPEGKPTKRGKRFGDVCRELQENGIFVNPRCLTIIVSCVNVDVCTRTVVHN